MPKVTVWMRPNFVAEIDSLAREVEMEIQMGLVWEDARVEWPKADEMPCGELVIFDVELLQ